MNCITKGHFFMKIHFPMKYYKWWFISKAGPITYLTHNVQTQHIKTNKDKNTMRWYLWQIPFYSECSRKCGKGTYNASNALVFQLKGGVLGKKKDSKKWASQVPHKPKSSQTWTYGWFSYERIHIFSKWLSLTPPKGVSIKGKTSRAV